jgi:tetratricopeptide (TPR) repeat protein
LPEVLSRQLMSLVLLAPAAWGCDLARAARLHQSGDYLGAVREYEACVSADPKQAEIRSNLGAALAGLGRYEEAIAQYRTALETANPGIAPQLRFNLALAYYKSFQINEAATEFEALHAMRPDDLRLALLIGDCRLRMAEYKPAIDLLVPFEAANPDDAALSYVLGMALIRDGRVAEGQRRVDRILGRGESGEGHFLLGVARFAAGDFPGAVREFSTANAQKPDLPSLHSYYGQALLFTGDADGAVVEFRKELAANPNDFDANYQLAAILANRGKSDEAKQLLERAVRVRPGSEQARDALAHGLPTQNAAEGDPGVRVGAPAPAVAGLDLAKLSKPTVLVFGSYTCPKLRSSAAALKNIAGKYGRSADFRLVYIREAHAVNSPEAQWQSTINEREGITLAPAKTVGEKREHAELCLRKLDLAWPAVVDGMDAAAENAYQAWPSRVYVVGKDGRVAFNSRLGELDFHPADLDAALRAILGGRTSDARPH